MAVPRRPARTSAHRGVLAARITSHGLPLAGLCPAALLELPAELPAAFLADLLGISVRTAMRWTQSAAGDWASYAAARTRASRR